MAGGQEAWSRRLCAHLSFLVMNPKRKIGSRFQKAAEVYADGAVFKADWQEDALDGVVCPG